MQTITASMIMLHLKKNPNANNTELCFSMLVLHELLFFLFGFRPRVLPSTKPPQYAYSSTPPDQSWAGLLAQAQQWRARGCCWVGHEGDGQWGRSWQSTAGEPVQRDCRWPDLARSSQPAVPPGRCSLWVPRRSCIRHTHTNTHIYFCLPVATIRSQSVSLSCPHTRESQVFL